MVVIDSVITDATDAVAAAHGAEVTSFLWNGHFPKKRTWFLRHHTPSTEWVLFLDADEILTPAVNQAFVDVELFSMQLSLACFALGLISCPLNLAIGNLREFRIKRFAGIPQYERLIMMMSFGYPVSGETDLVAACSARLPLNAVLTVH